MLLVQPRRELVCAKVADYVINCNVREKGITQQRDWIVFFFLNLKETILLKFKSPVKLFRVKVASSIGGELTIDLVEKISDVSPSFSSSKEENNNNNNNNKGYVCKSSGWKRRERVEAGEEEGRRYTRARLALNKGAASLISQPRIHGRGLVTRPFLRSNHRF